MRAQDALRSLTDSTDRPGLITGGRARASPARTGQGGLGGSTGISHRCRCRWRGGGRRRCAPSRRRGHRGRPAPRPAAPAAPSPAAPSRAEPSAAAARRCQPAPGRAAPGGGTDGGAHGRRPWAAAAPARTDGTGRYVRHGPVWHGTARYGTARYGYGTARKLGASCEGAADRDRAAAPSGTLAPARRGGSGMPGAGPPRRGRHRGAGPGKAAVPGAFPRGWPRGARASGTDRGAPEAVAASRAAPAGWGGGGWGRSRSVSRRCGDSAGPAVWGDKALLGS